MNKDDANIGMSVRLVSIYILVCVPLVKTSRWFQNALPVLWVSIQDMLEPDVRVENRHLALTLLQCVVSGQVRATGREASPHATWPYSGRRKKI